MPFIDPKRGHRDNAVIGLADRTQVSARHVIGDVTILVIARIVNHRYASARWCAVLGLHKQREPLRSDRFRVPTRFGQKELQPLYLGRLSLHQWFGAYQHSKCLGRGGDPSSANRVLIYDDVRRRTPN